MSVGASFDNGVLRLAIDVPESKNALNPATVADLRKTLIGARENLKLRLVILSSAVPRVFSLGMDLTLLKSGRDAGTWPMLAAVTDYADLLIDIARLPVPSIAVVDGVAAGGGVELACICDTVIASTESSFSIAQLRKGLFPYITSAVLVPRIGQSRLLHWALSGQNFPAKRMFELGLVNQLVAPDELERTLSLFIDRVAHFDPAALRAGILSLRAESGAEVARRIRHALPLFTLNCLAQSEGSGT